ncbi:MAG: hypothetical protein ACP5NE_02710 [Candidatus Micrarchaeia archaeon]
MKLQISLEALLWLSSGAFFIALAAALSIQIIHVQSASFSGILKNLSNSLNASIYPYSEFHIKII